jgi:hypothetical protein
MRDVSPGTYVLNPNTPLSAVSKALRYRLFKMGRMPAALTAAAAGPDVLVAEEGVSAKQTVSNLRMPRSRVNHGTSLFVGALVLTPARVLASLGDNQILDADPRASLPGAVASVEFAADGMRVSADIGAVVAGASGSFTLHFRVPIDAAALAQLPQTAVSVPLLDAGATLRPWGGKSRS